MEEKIAFVLDAVESGLAARAGISQDQVEIIFSEPEYEAEVSKMYDDLKRLQLTLNRNEIPDPHVDTPMAAFRQPPGNAAALPRTTETIMNALVHIDPEKRRRLIRTIGRAQDAQYKEHEVRTWAKTCMERRPSGTGPALEEALPYLNSAVRLSFASFTGGLFPVQLVAVSLLADFSQARPLLLQVNTGEGKSIIIAVAAALLALRGHKVDVHTSASNLAIREVSPGPTSKKGFFGLLGLRCSHNIDETTRVATEARECYKSEVVYGTTSSFCFDVLGDEYSMNGNMNGRTQDAAIVDEVDNMFLDQAEGVCRISGRAVGFADLSVALIKIWGLVLHVRREGCRIEYMGVSVAEGDERGRLVDAIVADLRSYLAEGSSRASSSELCVGRFAAEYMDKHADKYVAGALSALLDLKKNKHYIVKCGKVSIVDYANTGEELANTKWSDGIHQFVELKEGLQPSNISLESNFISIASMLRRYGGRLRGLTGTLGSEEARGLLRAEYGAQCVDLPTNLPSRRVDLPARVVPSDPGHLGDALVQTVRRCVQAGRPALVICSTINAVKSLAQALRRGLPGQRIDEVKVLSDLDALRGGGEGGLAADIGAIIVATNILGRGADIVLSERAKQAGGLFVVVTFVPPNLRVLLQAFGRSGRCGQPGSAQLLVASNVSRAVDIQDFKETLFEEGNYYDQMRVGMKENMLRDQVFNRFCLS